MLSAVQLGADLALQIGATAARQTGLGVGHFLREGAQRCRETRLPGVAGRAVRRLADLMEGAPAERAGFPPHHRGLPHVGNLLEFLDDPISVIAAGQHACGSMFTLRLGPDDVVVLLGSDLQERFFQRTDKELSIGEAYPTLRAMFGHDVYFFADPDEYAKQQGLVLPRFKADVMQSYVGVIQREIARFRATLSTSGTMELPQAFGPLVMRIAAAAFLGEEFAASMSDTLYAVFRDFSGGIDPILPPNAPLPRFAVSALAKRKLHDILQTSIDARRKMANPPDDFFQQLLVESATAYVGSPQTFVDAKIRNLMMILIWAGHETTVGQTAWVMAELLRPSNAEALQRIRTEIFAAAGGAPLTHEHLQRMPFTRNALLEVERLHPVAHMLLRMTTAPFEVGGYTLPTGTRVLVSPAVAHRLPDDFPEPHRFNPDRFEDSTQKKKLIGFGKGRHRCAGVNFAYLEMTLIAAELLRDYEMVVPQSPRPVLGPKTRWPAPFTVQYRRIPMHELLLARPGKFG